MRTDLNDFYTIVIIFHFKGILAISWCNHNFLEYEQNLSYHSSVILSSQQYGLIAQLV